MENPLFGRDIIIDPTLPAGTILLKNNSKQKICPLCGKEASATNKECLSCILLSGPKPIEVPIPKTLFKAQEWNIKELDYLDKAKVKEAIEKVLKKIHEDEWQDYRHYFSELETELGL